MLGICIQILLLASLAVCTPETTPDPVGPVTKTRSFYKSLKFSHPSHPGTVIEGRMKIVFPEPALRPHHNRSLYPVVVFLGGDFTESNRYQWLGERLAEDHGVAWVVTDMILPISGSERITPMAGGRFESHEPNPGLVALFKKLREVNNSTGLLQGRLDVDTVILGGHSWGGRVVLVDGANKGFFPNVVGAFVYATHAERLPGPGYIPGTMLPLEGSTPLLLMASRTDNTIGIGLPSSFESGIAIIRYMWEKAIHPKRKSYYVEFDGFTHVAIIYPEDDTLPVIKSVNAATNKTEVLEVFYRIVSLFVQKYALGDAQAINAFGPHLLNDSIPYIVDVGFKGY